MLRNTGCSGTLGTVIRARLSMHIPEISLIIQKLETFASSLLAYIRCNPFQQAEFDPIKVRVIMILLISHACPSGTTADTRHLDTSQMECF